MKPKIIYFSSPQPQRGVHGITSVPPSGVRGLSFTAYITAANPRQDKQGRGKLLVQAQKQRVKALTTNSIALLRRSEKSFEDLRNFNFEALLDLVGNFPELSITSQDCDLMGYWKNQPEPSMQLDFAAQSKQGFWQTIKALAIFAQTHSQDAFIVSVPLTKAERAAIEKDEILINTQTADGFWYSPVFNLPFADLTTKEQLSIEAEFYKTFGEVGFSMYIYKSKIDQRTVNYKLIFSHEIAKDIREFEEVIANALLQIARTNQALGIREALARSLGESITGIRRNPEQYKSYEKVMFFSADSFEGNERSYAKVLAEVSGKMRGLGGVEKKEVWEMGFEEYLAQYPKNYKKVATNINISKAVWEQASNLEKEITYQIGKFPKYKTLLAKHFSKGGQVKRFFYHLKFDNILVELTNNELLRYYQDADKFAPLTNFDKLVLEKNPIPRYHIDYVRQALAEGKPVPSEVLAEYPDLQPKKEKEVFKPFVVYFESEFYKVIAFKNGMFHYHKISDKDHVFKDNLKVFLKYFAWAKNTNNRFVYEQYFSNMPLLEVATILPFVEPAQLRKAHRELVENKLKSNYTVPAEVLAEYPDLQAEKLLPYYEAALQAAGLGGLGDLVWEQRRVTEKYCDELNRCFERQKPLTNIVQGRKTAVQFTFDKDVTCQYVILSAAELQPSHLAANQNPMYFLPEAQPRNRSMSESGGKTPELITRNLRPATITEGATAYAGASVVNTRGEVIQGNGRAYAMKLYWDFYPNDDRAYADFVYYNPTFQFEKDYEYSYNRNSSTALFTHKKTKQVTKIQYPVLVRMLEITDKEAIKLGQYGQSDLEATTSATQVVKSKGALITKNSYKVIVDELLLRDDGDKTLNELIRISKILSVLVGEKVLTINDLEKYLNKQTGEINEAGSEFVAKLLLQTLFADGDVNLPEIFANLPYTIQKGIEKGFLYLLKVPQSNSLNAELCKAIMALREFLASGTPFLTWVNQVTITGKRVTDTYTREELRLAEFLAQSKTQNDIATKFRQYATLSTPQAASMFNAASEGKPKQEAFQEVFRAAAASTKPSPSLSKKIDLAVGKATKLIAAYKPIKVKKVLESSEVIDADNYAAVMKTVNLSALPKAMLEGHNFFLTSYDLRNYDLKIKQFVDLHLFKVNQATEIVKNATLQQAQKLLPFYEKEMASNGLSGGVRKPVKITQHRQAVIDLVGSIEKNYVEELKTGQREANELVSQFSFTLAGERNKGLRQEIIAYLTGLQPTFADSTASKTAAALAKYLSKHKREPNPSYFIYDSVQKKYVLQEAELIALANNYQGILFRGEDYYYYVHEFDTGLFIASKYEKQEAIDLANEKCLKLDKAKTINSLFTKGFLSPNVENKAKKLLPFYEKAMQEIGS